MSENLEYDTRAEADKTPDRQFRRWNLEIKLAQKRERDWRKTANDILKRYRAKDRKKNSFNILWANTETLRPALYNSPPKPDVRRRFRQNDMLGRAVGEVSERSLTYCADAYDLDSVIKQDVLDALLPGRGLARVRYVPTIKQVNETEEGSPKGEGEHEAYEGLREEVEYEQCLCEHVQWDDFLHGPGKTWEEVCWVAFRHRLTRDDLIEKFGAEIGKEIKLDATDDEDIQKKDNEDIAGVFKRAELWEIWDKDTQKVLFIASSYKKGPIYAEGSEGEPPLKLRNFYPIPKPLQLVEDTGTLIPEPLYELYREQAEELDRLSTRINKIVDACRVRFAHDPSLTELKNLLDAGDNVGIPVENARAWMNNGGLEKAIWWMPIDQLVAVLKELYVARDTCKQVIYELTGISDIVRGQTDPNETLGAQQLKANYSNLRLQRMQKETARYVRDLIRLMAEVIGEQFSPETLAKMTGLNFPTAEQKQVAQLQAQAMQGPPAPGQPPPQPSPILSMPTWEDIMGVLKSDMQREYRIDVETNSTVAETLTQDMTGLKEVLTGIVEFWQGVGPAVQAGAVSIDAVKAITMTIVRRARMGLEVEDALENGLQAPKQATDPKAAAEAQKQQVEQLKALHDAKLAEQSQAHDQAIAQREQQLQQVEEQRQQAVELANHAREQDRLAMEAKMEDQKRIYEERIAFMEAQSKESIEKYKVDKDNDTKVIVAEISAKAQKEATLASAEQKANTDFSGEGKKISEILKQMHEDSQAPVRMDRGPDGRIAQITKGKRTMKVNRDAKGITIQ